LDLGKSRSDDVVVFACPTDFVRFLALMTLVFGHETILSGVHDANCFIVPGSGD
jgi:hypothetical protein